MQEKIKRDPKSHLKSLEMDPERKLLIVEGKEDRLFLEYLCGNEKDENVVILEIETVEIGESVSGGNRGRVLYFASIENNIKDRIKFFIDRDYSKFIDEEIPENITLTDFKDLESYLLSEYCFEKLLKIGIKSEKINSTKFLCEIEKATYFGFVRITSLKNNLNLSINDTNLKLNKYLNISKEIEIDLKKKEYLNSLISNSKNKIKIENLEQMIDKTVDDLSNEESKFIIHGKDLLAIVAEISHKLGKNKENLDNMFWMSFDSKKVEEFCNLNEIIGYAKKRTV